MTLEYNTTTCCCPSPPPPPRPDWERPTSRLGCDPGRLSCVCPASPAPAALFLLSETHERRHTTRTLRTTYWCLFSCVLSFYHTRPHAVDMLLQVEFSGVSCCTTLIHGITFVPTRTGVPSLVTYLLGMSTNSVITDASTRIIYFSSLRFSPKLLNVATSSPRATSVFLSSPSLRNSLTLPLCPHKHGRFFPLHLPPKVSDVATLAPVHTTGISGLQPAHLPGWRCPLERVSRAHRAPCSGIVFRASAPSCTCAFFLCASYNSS